MSAELSLREATKMQWAAADEIRAGQFGNARLLIDLASSHLADAREDLSNRQDHPISEARRLRAERRQRYGHRGY